MVSLAKRIIHRIAHLADWYSGEVETWWEGDKLMVGFKCSTCGCLSGIHEINAIVERELRGNHG